MIKTNTLQATVIRVDDAVQTLLSEDNIQYESYMNREGEEKQRQTA